MFIMWSERRHRSSAVSFRSKSQYQIGPKGKVDLNIRFGRAARLCDRSFALQNILNFEVYHRREVQGAVTALSVPIGGPIDAQG